MASPVPPPGGDRADRRSRRWPSARRRSAGCSASGGGGGAPGGAARAGAGSCSGGATRPASPRPVGMVSSGLSRRSVTRPSCGGTIGDAACPRHAERNLDGECDESSTSGLRAVRRGAPPAASTSGPADPGQHRRGWSDAPQLDVAHAGHEQQGAGVQPLRLAAPEHDVDRAVVESDDDPRRGARRRRRPARPQGVGRWGSRPLIPVEHRWGRADAPQLDVADAGHEQQGAGVQPLAHPWRARRRSTRRRPR